ncbi:MAG TPA: carboxy terminal-processing peptidase [Rudaea sp.]|nr:carboxy terminal-processing peptidase [Rudaea sp.]HSC11784.1 carboxy terminal-processing peptidase [Rhodanobacteraceae bacterium]
MRKILFLVALTLSCAVVASAKPAPNAGDVAVKPTPTQAQTAVLAARFLTRFHYKPEALDAKMSQQIFDRYLDALDSDRLFLLQSDVDRFAASRDKLGDAIYDQDLSAPFAIFNLYVQRVGERTAYSQELLKQGFDFSKDESYRYQRDKLPWAKTTEELNDVWQKRVKNDWLRLKLAGKKEADIRTTLEKRYANYGERLRQLNAEDVFQTFMNAYAMAIEPHTNYLGPRASENFDIAMKLSLEGIGAVLQRDEDYTAIREIVPGGPAALSGKLKVGDRIVGVGQGESGSMTDVVGWRLDDVVEKIRGAKDTTVRLEVIPADAGPDGKHFTLSMVRKKVLIEEQAAKSSVIDIKDGDVSRKIGVISLPTFYQDFDARRRGDKDYKSATRDVAKLLGELKKQNVEGVLVDLRNNGGGSLSEATDLTGLFIGKGPVVQVRSANGRIEEEQNADIGMAWSGPLAVLINRNSASASEIFAAAIQDYGRGLIIGEPSYGKGTVQNLVDLDQVKGNEKPSYGELKMTIAQFFRVNGGSTQLRGVTPDISFPLTIDFDQNGEQAFDNALPWTSIAAAGYTPSANLATVVPMLEARHEARVAQEKEWQALQADIADYRKLRKDTTISLNEQVRRAERDEQERKKHERHPELAAANSATSKETVASAEPGSQKPADGKIPRVPVDSNVPTDAKGSATTPKSGAQARADTDQPGATAKYTDVHKPKVDTGTTKDVAAADAATDPARDESTTDDGLQADERSIKTDLAAERKRKIEKDVVLNEVAHILADEVTLIRADNKLAARVLPHTALNNKDIVD